MSHFMMLFILPPTFWTAVLQVIFLLCINERSSDYWILFIEEIDICDSWINEKYKMWNNAIPYLTKKRQILILY